MKREKVKCNQCGQDIQVFDGDSTQDYLQIRKKWGYFSKKDGTKHAFCLCETCYDKLIGTFVIPVQVSDVSEYL